MHDDPRPAPAGTTTTPPTTARAKARAVRPRPAAPARPRSQQVRRATSSARGPIAGSRPARTATTTTATTSGAVTMISFVAIRARSSATAAAVHHRVRPVPTTPGSRVERQQVEERHQRFDPLDDVGDGRSRAADGRPTRARRRARATARRGSKAGLQGRGEQRPPHDAEQGDRRQHVNEQVAGVERTGAIANRPPGVPALRPTGSAVAGAMA